MSKDLKSLEDHDREATSRYRATITKDRFDVNIRNGIECPSCGEELLDIWSSATLYSIYDRPPRKQVQCQKCDFIGTRVA